MLEPMQQPEITWATRRSHMGIPGQWPGSFIAADTTRAADSWVENGNVVFSFTVFLSKDTVADALDGYEGKPYSNPMNPDEGVIGTGYAMTREELDHILYDVLDTPLGPAENPERTTELCCIVVTEEEISSSSIGK